MATLLAIQGKKREQFPGYQEMNSSSTPLLSFISALGNLEIDESPQQDLDIDISSEESTMLTREPSGEKVAPLREKKFPKLERKTSSIYSLTKDEDTPSPNSDASSLDTRIRTFFGLSTDDRYEGEYSCWLTRDVLLKGYLYFTNHHILFYSYIPEGGEDNEAPSKEGFLTKRATSLAKFSKRRWFVLKGSVLRCYDDAKNTHFPHRTIDLKFIQKVEASKTKDSCFVLIREDKVNEFDAETEVAMREWVNVLNRTILRLQNQGDSIKIIIPVSDIVEYKVTSVLPHTESLQIDFLQGSDYAVEEYFFSYFKDIRATFDHLAQLITNAAGEKATKGSLSISVESSRKSDETSDSRKESRRGSSILGFVGGIAGVAVGTSKATYNYFLGDEDKQEVFQKVFKTSEKVISDFQVAYVRTIPHYGTLFLSESHLAFRARSFATFRETAILLSLSDVLSVKKVSSGLLIRNAFIIFTKESKQAAFLFQRFTLFIWLNLILILIHQLEFEASSEGDRQAIIDLISKLQAEMGSKKATIPSSKSERLLTSLVTESGAQDSHVLPPPLLKVPVISDRQGLAKPQNLPKHITFLTIGSRGDVQPMIAFAKRLKQEGHQVRIASHDEFETWVLSHGIEFRRLGGNPAALLGLMSQHAFFSPAFMKNAVGIFYDWFDDLLKTSFDACLGTECLFASPYSFVGYHVAEALNIPLFNFCPFPWTKTKAFPHPLLLSESNIGAVGSVNWMSYTVLDNLIWRALAPKINSWRKESLSLSPLLVRDDSKTPTINCFDANLTPPPSDWPDWVHICGFFFLDNPNPGWNPDPSLLQFLEKTDKKIVYIGFGSIVVEDPEKMTEIVIEAVEKANVNAILAKGWSGRADSKKSKKSEPSAPEYPPFIYPIQSVPHDWLFPQIHGVVHHGGAGTTAAGFRAGRPTVIKPFFGDQFFWGEQIDKMKVGVMCRELTVQRMTAALVSITTDPQIIQSAENLGKRIRESNGVESALHVFYRDLDLASSVIKERHEENVRGTSVPLLKSQVENQKAEIAALKEALASKDALIQEQTKIIETLKK